MNFREYSEFRKSTDLGSTHQMPTGTYAVMGLAGEAGEVAEKLKKLYRDRSGQVDQEWRRQFVNELGDVLWYLDRLAADFGYDLEDVASANMFKLNGRMERQTLHGSGDER